MDFDTYKKNAVKTAVYPKDFEIPYLALGIAGEVGEFCNKLKKVYRDCEGTISREFVELSEDELGDVLWYLANLAEALGLRLESIATKNNKKLFSRLERGTLRGSGDSR